jgi:predicted 3-demethylubiquinone-9 3-methyltransferase (glyoxalase superfamily)
MQKIIPHLWCDDQAEEAARFCTGFFLQAVGSPRSAATARRAAGSTASPGGMKYEATSTFGSSDESN